MSAAASLLPQLEAVVQQGSAQHRAETLRRITGLFVERAASFNEQHVALFDDVFGYLIDGVEPDALAEMARNLAPLRNAPPGILRTLAYNVNIDIAGPVLRQAAVGEADLKLIAETASPAHLLALASRQDLSEALADTLIARGDRDVVSAIAAHNNVHLSEDAFTALVQKAERDNALGEKLSLRTDIPPNLFRHLLMRGSDLVQKRLLAQARPASAGETAPASADVLEGAVEVAATPQSDRDAALAAARKLHAAHKLGETDIAEFAASGQYEKTLAALAIVCAVPIEVVDRLMKDDRVDPLLILSRAGGFNWPTVLAIIGLRPNEKIVERALDAARENFERLTATTAQRVLRFWQARPGNDE
jgi:uncharacterized protein (DUF2336 family)